MKKNVYPVVAVFVPEDEDEPVVTFSRSADETLAFPTVKAGPKTPLRFTVGDPDGRGTVWRLFANPNADDVYLASRHSAGEFKVSFHESGDWRVQTIRPREVRFKMLNGPQGRILMQWWRPDADEAGWTHAVSIVLPSGHLPNVPVKPSEDIQWIQGPPEGHYVELGIHLVRPGVSGVAFGPMLARLSAIDFALVHALRLPGGEVVVVTATTAPIDREEAANIELYESQGAELTEEFPDFDTSPSTGPRHLGMGVNDRGDPRFYDLALGVRTYPAP